MPAHSWASQTSCSIVPAGQLTAPSISTNRHTLLHVVPSGDSATAL
jgi:hypothetical protein